ncbi:uncharacterized protein LOC103500005 isoform X3 [Cucumis melo]|uniref:DNA-directed RNA polymerase subunit n=1 Tax=Cucumis melo TaxID=3656 RepID=A0A1S3CF30_CUCME|nr:uncharacterized protein LOC103500005 isoform X3 [Cucumis melo]
MFYLSRIEHTLRVPPSLLNLPILDAIKGELEKLFIDKVVANLGLCISVYDIRSVDGGFIFPSDGAATYKVVFTLIVFRPFTGEYHLDFSRIFMFRSSLCPLDLNSHQMKIMVEDADGCGSIMKYRSTYMNLMRHHLTKMDWVLFRGGMVRERPRMRSKKIPKLSISFCFLIYNFVLYIIQ